MLSFRFAPSSTVAQAERSSLRPQHHRHRERRGFLVTACRAWRELSCVNELVERFRGRFAFVWYTTLRTIVPWTSQSLVDVGGDTK